MRKSISFSEVCGNSTIKSFADSVVSKMTFPLSGSLFLGLRGNNPYIHKGVHHSSDKSLLDLETAISWIISRKNEKWETTFYVAQTLGTQLLIRVCKKNEGDEFLINIHELCENGYSLDTILTPLETVKTIQPEISFDLSLIEDFPDEPNSRYKAYSFNQYAMPEPLHVSEDGKTMFIVKGGEYRRVWPMQLSTSVNRFLKKEIKNGVLAQTIYKRKFVYLLENGMVYNHNGDLDKHLVDRETYEYLVMLAEESFGGKRIHAELTPCLFY